MNCHDARKLLSALVDGELTPDERSQAEAHLTECADCRKEHERLGATIALLRQIDRPRAPVGFVDRVLEAVQPTPWYRRWLGSLFLPLSVKLPAEAAALLLVGGLAVFVFQRTPELQQAARQHPAPEVARERTVFSSSPAQTMASHPAETSPPPAKTSPPLSSLPRSVVRTPPPSEVPSDTLLSRKRDEAALQGELMMRQELSKAVPEQKNVTPSERDVDTAAKVAPPAPTAPPSSRPTAEERFMKREMDSVQESTAARQVEPSPPARPAPALDQRIDATKEKAMQAPAAAAPSSRSAMRMLRSADVTGRLAVKDLDTAQRALADLLTQSGAVMISRREDAGSLLVEVAVPKTAFADFNAGLTRIGTWQSQGEPSESVTSVRITLRLVQ
jgi:Putative zinc-finger